MQFVSNCARSYIQKKERKKKNGSRKYYKFDVTRQLYKSHHSDLPHARSRKFELERSHEMIDQIDDPWIGGWLIERKRGALCNWWNDVSLMPCWCGSRWSRKRNDNVTYSIMTINGPSIICVGETALILDGSLKGNSKWG